TILQARTVTPTTHAIQERDCILPPSLPLSLLSVIRAFSPMHVEEMHTFFANDLCCFRLGVPPFSYGVRQAPRTIVGLQCPCACTTKARPSYDNTLWSRAEKPFENSAECRCTGRGF